LAVVVLALELILNAAASLRSAAATLAVFARHGYLPSVPLAPSTLRAWLLRLGCASLTRPLPRDRPWAWLIDHTLQIGAEKLFVIAGCLLDEVPFGQRPLQLSDLTLIALVPMSASNQERIAAELERASARTGAPRQIVSDGAADLQRGIERFAAAHPHTVAVTDAAHHAANLLKHYWEKDPRWQELTRRMHQTAAAIRQTRAAYLLAPRLRNKARFMSAGVFVRFGRLLLRRLQEAVPPPEVVQHYGWVSAFAVELTAWQEQQALVAALLQQVRVEGLFARSAAELEREWEQLPLSAHPTTRALRDRLRGYVARSSRGLRAPERLVGSTEVLESAFGVQKRLAADQAEGGLTALTLALGAVLGKHTAETVRADLEAVPQKKAESWARRTLGQTVQWLRRRFFAGRPTAEAVEPKPVPISG
jgi:hypothetical protein